MKATEQYVVWLHKGHQFVVRPHAWMAARLFIGITFLAMVLSDKYLLIKLPGTASQNPERYAGRNIASRIVPRCPVPWKPQSVGFQTSEEWRSLKNSISTIMVRNFMQVFIFNTNKKDFGNFSQEKLKLVPTVQAQTPQP